MSSLTLTPVTPGTLTLSPQGTSVPTDPFWDAKGDLAVGSGPDAASRLAVGTNGYVLTADSAQTLGIKWAAIPGGGVVADTIWDAKGDLAVGTAADTAQRLAVGSNGQVLTADSTQTTGVKWATASGGGVTQLAYQEFSTTVTVSATSDTPLSGTTLVVSAGAVTYDGSTRVCIEGFAPWADTGTSFGQLRCLLTDGTSADFGRVALFQAVSQQLRGPIYWQRFLTPSAGSHTFQWRAFRQVANCDINAGSGAGADGPGWIRITSGS